MSVFGSGYGSSGESGGFNVSPYNVTSSTGSPDMWNLLLPLIMSGIGTGMSAAGNASAQNSQEAMSKANLQFQRDQMGLRQGPSPQMMKLSEMLTQNYNPVSYTPGQGYSAPSSFNLQKVLAGLQPVVGPEAQAANTADFNTAKNRAMYGQNEADREYVRTQKRASGLGSLDKRNRTAAASAVPPTGFTGSY